MLTFNSVSPTGYMLASQPQPLELKPPSVLSDDVGEQNFRSKQTKTLEFLIYSDVVTLVLVGANSIHFVCN